MADMIRNRLRDVRSRRNYTIGEVARMMGISETTLHNWEYNLNYPSVERLMQLADIYQVSTDYLLGREDRGDFIKYQDNVSIDYSQLIQMHGLPVWTTYNNRYVCGLVDVADMVIRFVDGGEIPIEERMSVRVTGNPVYFSYVPAHFGTPLLLSEVKRCREVYVIPIFNRLDLNIPKGFFRVNMELDFVIDIDGMVLPFSSYGIHWLAFRDIPDGAKQGE